MADKKISELTAKTTIHDDDLFVLVDSEATPDETKKIAGTYVRAGRTATYIVAASDAPDHVKAQADYVCDGTADDVEIQAALDALVGIAYDGGRVLLSEGTYNTSAPIVWPIQSGITLEGQGPENTVLKLTPNSDCNVIEHTGEGVYFGTIKSLKIHGNRSSQASGSGIYITGDFNDARFEDLYVNYCKEYGMYIYNTWTTSITNCISENNDLDGLFIRNGPSIVTGGFYSYNRNGIKIATAGDFLISGATCRNNNEKGIHLSESGHGLIIGCHTYGAPDGIYIQNSAKLSIIGNQIYSNTGSGITLRSSGTPWPTDNVITDNLIYSNDKGFYLVEHENVPISRIVVANNIFYDNTTNFSVYDEARDLDTWRMYNKYSDIFMDVLAEDADHVVAAEDLTAATPITCTLAAQPDVPRNVTIEITDADTSITAFQITVSGVDAKGNSTSEVFDESGGLTQTGNVAFATISSVKVDSITGVGAGDVLDVGIGSKLGLSNVVYETEDVYKVKKNNADWASANYTVNTTYDTVDVSTGGAITGGDDFTIFYRSNLNIIS